MGDIDYFELIKSKLGVSEILSHYGHFQDNSGKFNCPFHPDVEPNDFQVTNDEIGYCWACHKWGDIFEIIQEKENCSKYEALIKAGELAGVQLDKSSKNQEELQKIAEQRNLNKKRIEVLTTASNLFQEALTPDLKERIKKERGWTEETINKFKIGYSIKGIKQKLIEKGFKEEEVVGGLVSEKGYEYFQDRIMFPYFNANRCLYFIGRQTEDTPKDEYNKAKYIKLKADYLTNPIFNTDSLKNSEELFITEGIADCISLDQTGFACISPVTTTFKKKDFPLLLKYSHNKTTYIANDNEGNHEGEEGAIATAIYLFKNGIANVQIITIPKPEDKYKIDICEYLSDKQDKKKAMIELIENNSQHIIDFEIARIKNKQDFNKINSVFELMSYNLGIPLDSFFKNLKEKTGITPANAQKKINQIIQQRQETEKEKLLLEESRRQTEEINKRLQEKENQTIPVECLNELKNPNLLNNLVEEVQQSVVGENNSITSILLATAGKDVENCQTASYNLIVNSKSGTGKDYTTGKVLDLWSSDICIKRTRISKTALTYWHNAKFEPDWTWDGKILVLQDIAEEVLNSDVFKVMQSDGSCATIVINNMACDIKVNGKPVMIITTAKSSPNMELLRRNSICQLDESEEQTKAILKQQAKNAIQGKVNKSNPKLKESLKYLRRVKVLIPFAESIVEQFPTKSLVMRTLFNRFIDYIKASASLHQYQRDKKDSFILATGEDYDITREVFEHLTKNGNMIPITRDQQDILDKGFSKESEWKSVEAINSNIAISDKWLRIQLDQLVEMGLLDVKGIKTEISDKIVRHYMKLPITDKIKLKPFSELVGYTNPTTPNITTITTTTTNGKELNELYPEVAPNTFFKNKKSPEKADSEINFEESGI